MVCRIYSFNGKLEPIGITYTALGDYELLHYDAGTFDISMPLSAQYADTLRNDHIILIDNMFVGLIENYRIHRGDGVQTVRATGRDIRCLLDFRVTVPDDIVETGAPAGYISASGHTESVMKYFVNKSLVNPSYARRKIEGVQIAPDLKRGTENDAYYSRFESLLAVEKKIGERAKLGYRLSIKDQSLVFDVAAGVDHSASQTANMPVLFDVDRGTLSSFDFASEAQASGSAFYCTRSGAEFEDEAFTQTYYFDDQITSGLVRREKHLNISVATDEENIYDEMETVARKDMESYKATESYSCDVTRQIYTYGVDYNVGDIVTIRDTYAGIQADRQLVGIKVAESESGIQYTATFGDTSLTKFDLIKRGG